MADTVWIVSGARDLPVVIAHELAHVLADSGNHSDEAGNLMREETTNDGTRLTAAQCEAIVTTASANGLMKPLR
jgi:predicted metalloendopeptidase